MKTNKLKKEIYKIKVTQDDIDSGKRDSLKKCPIALAIRRTLPKKYYDISVDYSVSVGRRARVRGKRFTVYDEYPLSGKVIAFISKFDNGIKVSPLKFNLEIMPI